MAISREELIRLARTGAAARVQELRKELDAIYKTFPDLKGGAVKRKTAAGRRRSAPAIVKRSWTAADRKAVSDRMKKYWAARRGGKTAKSAK